MHPTLLLTIATLALVVGPLLGRLGSRLPGIAAAIDGATVAGIVVVAFLHLLPEAGAHLGWWTALLFGLGLLLPALAEGRLHRLGSDSWSFTVGGLVLVLLLLHVVVESAALASRANEQRIGVATLLVIVGHRLPLGLVLWGHTRKRMGLYWSLALLGTLAAATFLGPSLVPERFKHGEFSAVLSALLAGGLLHLVLQHRPSLGAGAVSRARRNLHSTLGVLVALAFFIPYLGGVSSGHSHDDAGGALSARLWDLVLETSGPLLLGVVGAALIEAFLPGSIAHWLSGGSRLRQALRGVVVGTPMPVCSCGVLPIYRSLVQRGVAPTAALALLVAAPEIGLDSLLLSLPMLGVETTVARLVCALALALAVGLLVGRLASAAGPTQVSEPSAPATVAGSLAAVRRGLLETWGHLSPWILFGLMVTVLVEPWISTEWAQRLPPWSQVVVLSLAGMPTYICATAATPFAALLLAKGFSAGAVIAFLLTGPATNVTTYGALRSIHSRGLATGFVLTALLSTWLLGMGVDLVLDSARLGAPLADAEHAHGSLALAAAFLLAGLTLWVIVREGPRGFLAQLLPEGSAARDGHHHGHGHGGHADPHAHESATQGP